jgi:general secretion pathway protein J
MKKRKNEGGFTLLELIISITITAVILVILLSALRLGHRSQEKGTEADISSQHMRMLNDRLTWLIRGAYPYTIKIEGEETLQFKGSARSLGFVTTSTDIYSDSPEDMAGLKWVTIYKGKEGLKIRESVFFFQDEAEGEEEAEKDLILDPTVTGISFKYMDFGGEDEEIKSEVWVEGWDTEEKNYLPAAILAEITLDIGGKEVFLPPILARVRSGDSPIMLEE